MGPKQTRENVAEAINTLGIEMKLRNKHTFGNVNSQIKRSNQKIEEMHKHPQTMELVEALHKEEKKLT